MKHLQIKVNSAEGKWKVDAIDRDALIDYCLKLIDVERKQGSDVMNYGQERVNQTEAIIDYIEHMPHVNADRPQGEWVFGYDDETKEKDLYAWTCSLCGGKYPWQPNYCPNCGAKMEVNDE